MGSSPLGGFLQRTNVGRLNVDVWLADLKAYAEMTQSVDVTTSKVVYLGFESKSIYFLNRLEHKK